MKRKNNRITEPKTLSFQPAVATFLEQRSKALGMNQSEYVQKLIVHDQSNNVIADALREDADKAETVGAGK